MELSPQICLLLCFQIVIFLQNFQCAKRVEVDIVTEDLADLKDFKKLLRTKNNILVLFSKSAKDAKQMFSKFQSVAKDIRGEGTLAFVDCSSESKKLCKKLKVDPATYIIKHYKDGEFHKDYDRKETVQSMITFMRDPIGDIPWEEEDASMDVNHISDAVGLQRLLSKETKPILVMFYAPWCGYCKKMKPDFVAAATEVKHDAVFAAMDVNKPENSPIRHHFNITGFPTIIYFAHGQEKLIYEGENNKESLVNFIKNPHKPKPKVTESEWRDIPSEVVHLTDANFDELISQESSVLVMFYAPWCGHCKTMKPEYVTAAEKLKVENIPGVLAAVDATKETVIGSKFGIKGYPAVKYFKNGQFSFDVSLRTSDKIIEFMKDPKEPPPPPPPELPWHETVTSVSHLGDDNFKTFLKKKKHALVMFYAPWCGHCKKAKGEYERAAEEFADNLQVAFSAVDCTVHNTLCGEYDVSGFPTIKYFSYLKNVAEYDGERTESGFVSFMKNPQDSGQSKKEPSTDFWADLSGSDKLNHLSESTFDAFIQEKDSVLVMFYVPWCGHCKSMKPAFAEAAGALTTKHVEGSLATVDCTAAKSLTLKYSISGYPTVKYFRKGEFVTDYKGSRAANDLISFMQKPPSKKEEL